MASAQEAIKMHLLEVGYDRTFGARPLRRAIQRELETPLSKRLLKSDIKPGYTVVANYTPEEVIAFSVEETAPAETQPASVQT